MPGAELTFKRTEIRYVPNFGEDKDEQYIGTQEQLEAIQKATAQLQERDHAN
jgi:hypothetical protein